MKCESLSEMEEKIKQIPKCKQKGNEETKKQYKNQQH